MERTLCVGISGATSSGKSSVSKLLQKEFSNCLVVHQDEFYNDDKYIPFQDGFSNWESPEALNFESLRKTIQQFKEEENNRFLICEGFLLFHDSSLLNEFDIKIFLSISYETCKSRRFARDEWIRENPTYFDKFIWPSYENYLKQIKEMKDIIIIDSETLSIEEVASICKKEIEKLKNKT